MDSFLKEKRERDHLGVRPDSIKFKSALNMGGWDAHATASPTQNLLNLAHHLLFLPISGSGPWVSVYFKLSSHFVEGKVVPILSARGFSESARDLISRLIGSS